MKLDKSNELNHDKINLLETQLNDSKNLYKNNINELEIKLAKDFQLKLNKIVGTKM